MEKLAVFAEKLDARINDSQTVIQAIPDSITKNAVCIGAIPGVKKDAFIVGGIWPGRRKPATLDMVGADRFSFA